MQGEWRVYKMYAVDGEFYNVGKVLSNARDVIYCIEWTRDKKVAEMVRYKKNKEEQDEDNIE